MSTTLSARRSVPFSALPGLTAQEIRIGVTAVLIFIMGTCLYCLSYQAWVAAVTPNLIRTVGIAFKEWGAWIVLTPIAFSLFRMLDTRAAWYRQVLTGIAVAFIAALVPTIVDHLTGIRPAFSSLAIFWPRFMAMTLVIYLLWRVLLRRTPPVEPSPAAAPTLASRPETLLVSKGADQCLIRLGDIQHASAAGNYIELWARNQRYLIRSTMAKLEALLASGDYVRIHRSHLVRVDEIERIRTHRSGNGTVELRSGHTLPLSKGYRAELLRRKLDSTLCVDSSR
jgi:hypothetical protein